MTNWEKSLNAMVQQRNVLTGSEHYYSKNNGKQEFGTTYTK